MRIFLLAFLCIFQSGCSVYMAATQEDKKDVSVLTVDTPRSVVIGKLGAPNSSEKEDGKRVDYYSFVQGYSKGNKVARAVGHGAMDVLTLGLWEVLGTPAEAVFDGKKINAEIFYDENNKVEKVNSYEGE